MTLDRYTAVNGKRATSVVLSVPYQGPWFADVILELADAVSGRVTLQIGALELTGTVDDRHSGTFGLRRQLRVVAGGGGWGKVLPARPYHNDAGVKALNVASDAAREAGEQLGTFTPRNDRLSADYLRQAVAASQTLEEAAGGVPWWVDYQGVTHVAERPEAPQAAGSYEVLHYDPRHRLARIAVDDPGAIGIGSVIAERLDDPQTVRSFQLTVNDKGQAITAWCGGGETSRSRLADLFAEIARLSTGNRLWGRWRYRVVQLAADRVHLQVVSKATGLPDAAHVRLAPGAPGYHAKLALGSIVEVEFLEGRRDLPRIVGFPGAGEPGHVPDEVVIADGTAYAARAGDAVEVAMPPAVFSGTIGGAPATGVLTFLVGTTLGAIKGSSSKVKIG